MIPADILRAFAVGLPQHRMKVCHATYDRFQQIPFGDFSRAGLTVIDWSQVWSEDLDAHQRKLP